MPEPLVAASQLDAFVDADRGVISREIFVSESIFQQEMRNLFKRAWLFVGHESQVPNPGDYFQSRMGAESVLLSRDDEGQVHVLLNSCRHRGMKVCRYDEGNATEFTCPYHGWSYSVDGTLVNYPGELYGVPQFSSYAGNLDKTEWSLVRAARIHNYRGLIFATWDAAAPDFLDYLGDFRFWLDNLTDSVGGVEGGTVAVRGVLKWRVNANWKFVAENFLGDMYHGRTTHSSVDAVGIGPGGLTAAANGTRRHGHSLGLESNIPGETSFVRLGHGACFSLDYLVPPPVFEEPELTAYFAQQDEQRTAKFAARGTPLGAKGPATLFPSMSFHGGGFPRGLLVAHPVSAHTTEIWRWILVEKDAPAAVSDWLRRYYLRYSGPAGMTEQDDMENWDYASKASTGEIARDFPYNYQLGLGETRQDPRLRGAVVATTPVTEENARNYFRRWKEFVRGDSWAELMEGT